MTNESVSAELLADYGILSMKPGRKSLQSSTIERLFNRAHLKINVDYIIRPRLGSNSRGAPKNIYYLTPNAFKIWLISSENENKYRDYLFLEKCVHYYNMGQINNLEEELRVSNECIIEQKEVIVEKESTIDRLERLMHKQTEEYNKLMIKLDIQHEEHKSQMNTLQSTLDKIVKKLDDRALPPSKEELTEKFVLMKKGLNVFYVIRTQHRRLAKAVTGKEKLGYSKVQDLIESESIPNSIYLWNVIKEILVKERKIACKYNEITLKDFSEFDLADMIKQVFDSRKCIE